MIVIQKRRFRYRLWWLMGLIGALAVFAAAVVSPLDTVAVSTLLVVVGAFFLLALYVLFAVVPYNLLIRRLRCPACSEPRLFCSTMVMFWPPLQSFHLCLGCGSRFKRFFAGRWLDAKGPDDDRWFSSCAFTPADEKPRSATPDL